jgi:hypothetical protein
MTGKGKYAGFVVSLGAVGGMCWTLDTLLYIGLANPAAATDHWSYST